MLEVGVSQGSSVPEICQNDVGGKLSSEDESFPPTSNEVAGMVCSAYERDAGSNVLINS